MTRPPVRWWCPTCGQTVTTLAVIPTGQPTCAHTGTPRQAARPTPMTPEGTDDE